MRILNDYKNTVDLFFIFSSKNVRYNTNKLSVMDMLKIRRL